MGLWEVPGATPSVGQKRKNLPIKKNVVLFIILYIYIIII